MYFSEKHLITSLRISMSLIFLWAFFDKVFGLGFSTVPEAAWIRGGSPTTGYLQYATHGPLASFFQSLAGSAGIDWLFMLGLLGIGVGLLMQKFIRSASYAGMVMLLLMYLSALPPKHHPFLDEHVVYALLLAYIAKKDTTHSLT